MTQDIRERVFFYGLFMNEALLHELGIKPKLPVISYVEGYGLRIGERALLVESQNEKVFGVAYSLPSKDLTQLYSASSVQDYRPIAVISHSVDTGEKERASCYNLDTSKLKGANIDYALKLIKVAETLDLPSSYIDHIRTFTV